MNTSRTFILCAEPSLQLSSYTEKYIGKKLRARRISFNLNQNDIAVKLQISGEQIYKYENGTEVIPAHQLYQLSRILHVPLSYFYEDVDDNRMF